MISMPNALTLLLDTRHKLSKHGINMTDIVLNQSPKSQSVQICKQFLKLHIQRSDIQFSFDNYPNKKDDLSDCLLQALAYYNMYGLSMQGSSFQRLIRAPELSDLTDNLIIDLTDD
jgi:hypothetical protein